jgi:hypothetical protein
VVNECVLLLAYVAVRLVPSAKVVSLGPRGQGAVVGRVLAVAQIESFAKNDVSGRGPVTPRDTVVEGISSPSAALVGAAAVVVETAPATAVLEAAAASVKTTTEAAPASVAAVAAAALAALFLLVVGLR